MEEKKAITRRNNTTWTFLSIPWREKESERGYKKIQTEKVNQVEYLDKTFSLEEMKKKEEWTIYWYYNTFFSL